MRQARGIVDQCRRIGGWERGEGWVLRGRLQTGCGRNDVARSTDGSERLPESDRLAVDRCGGKAAGALVQHGRHSLWHTGRASCRARVCVSVSILVAAGSLTTTLVKSTYE